MLKPASCDPVQEKDLEVACRARWFRIDNSLFMNDRRVLLAFCLGHLAQSVADLKARLLRASAGVNRGLSCREGEQEEILEIVKELEVRKDCNISIMETHGVGAFPAAERTLLTSNRVHRCQRDGELLRKTFSFEEYACSRISRTQRHEGLFLAQGDPWHHFVLIDGGHLRHIVDRIRFEALQR